MDSNMYAIFRQKAEAPGTPTTTVSKRWTRGEITPEKNYEVNQIKLNSDCSLLRELSKKIKLSTKGRPEPRLQERNLKNST